jgi:hypothetical protein
MGTHRSYIWCHQEPNRSAGTRQGIHDATSQRMCCGKWSVLWTSYVILKRVPAHEPKSLFLGTCSLLDPYWLEIFCLSGGGGRPRKSLWHRFWDTLYRLMIRITNEFPSYLHDVDKLLVSVCSSPPGLPSDTSFLFSKKTVRYMFDILRPCIKRSVCFFEMFLVLVLKRHTWSVRVVWIFYSLLKVFTDLFKGLNTLWAAE